MADGARFEIDIEAKSLGVDSSAAQLDSLADKISDVDKVATVFDATVAAAAKRLEETSDAANVAAQALGRAQSKYNGLEVAADRAAKKLEEATAAGKSAAALDKLRAQSDKASAAMRAQMPVVAELEAKHKAAAAAQAKSAATLKTLEASQKAAAVEAKKGGKVAASSSVDLAAMGKAGALAYLAVGVAAVGAAGAAMRFAVASNPLAMMRVNLAAQRLQFSLVKLFRGLDLSKFLGALDRMGALFDTTNTSGRALKLLVETILQPLFDAVAKAEPYVSEFFKGMISGALDVVIAVLTLRNAIFKAMSPETRAEIKKLVDKVFTLENAFMLGEVAAVAFAVVVGGVVLIALAACAIAAASLAAALSVVALALVGIALTIGLLVAIVLLPFVLLGVAVAGIVALFDGTWDDFAKTMKGLAKKAWNWGSNIVNGLTGGLLGGSEDLTAAGNKIAKQVEDSIKNPLKIKSPSLVMHQIGAWTSAGFAGGIESGTDDVAEASGGMADAAKSGASGGGTVSTSSASSRSIHIAQITINADGGDGASITAAVKRALLEVFEGASLTIGGGEVPA